MVSISSRRHRIVLDLRLWIGRRRRRGLPLSCWGVQLQHCLSIVQFLRWRRNGGWVQFRSQSRRCFFGVIRGFHLITGIPQLLLLLLVGVTAAEANLLGLREKRTWAVLGAAIVVRFGRLRFGLFENELSWRSRSRGLNGVLHPQLLDEVHRLPIAVLFSVGFGNHFRVERIVQSR